MKVMLKNDIYSNQYGYLTEGNTALIPDSEFNPEYHKIIEAEAETEVEVAPKEDKPKKDKPLKKKVSRKAHKLESQASKAVQKSEDEEEDIDWNE